MQKMTLEEAKNYIKANVDPRNYLEKARVHGYICPFCNSGAGSNGTGLEYFPNSNKVTCFVGCKEKNGGRPRDYDVIDIYSVKKYKKENYKNHFMDALQDLAAEAGIEITRGKAPQSRSRRTGDKNTAESAEEPKKGSQGPQNENEPDYSRYYEYCRAQLTLHGNADTDAAVSYLSARGISLETAVKYGIGFDPQADPANNPGGSGQNVTPAPRLIIPVKKSSYIGHTIDLNAKKYKKINSKNGTAGTLNLMGTRSPDVIFIVEGIFDALSVLEAGFSVVCLNSTSNADKFLEELEAGQKKKDLRSKTFVLSCDNDDEGRRANSKLRKELNRLNVAYVDGSTCGPYKDPNDYIVNDRAGFLAAAERDTEQALQPDDVSQYIQHQMGDDMQKFQADIPTGFNNLDAQISGLYSGLYVVAAITSLGKTTFAHQMADQLAASGHDVLYFSLEQSRLEMVSKSIARIIAQDNPRDKITADSLQIRKNQGGKAAQDAAKKYLEKIGHHLSIIEGNYNCTLPFIGNYIRNYSRRNNTSPIVFIDYLQVLQPEEEDKRKSAKDVMDSAMTALKRLSRELNIIIIVISSVNRANYLTPIDFESLKESGGIEYTADVVWGLQLHCLQDPLFETEKKITQKRDRIKDAKKAIPREIDLVCLKNRFGISSFTIGFNYYSSKDLFEDADLPPIAAEPKQRKSRI